MSSHHLTARQLAARIREFAPGTADMRDIAALDRRWALLAVDVFNARIAAGRRILFAPTVGAALLSGHHWLHVLCPACRTIGTLDLRVVPRPSETPVTAILPSLRCRTCEGRNPPPSIVRLSPHHSLA